MILHVPLERVLETEKSSKSSLSVQISIKTQAIEFCRPLPRIRLLLSLYITTILINTMIDNFLAKFRPLGNIENRASFKGEIQRIVKSTEIEVDFGGNQSGQISGLNFFIILSKLARTLVEHMEQKRREFNLFF